MKNEKHLTHYKTTNDIEATCWVLLKIDEQICRLSPMGYLLNASLPADRVR